jgi:hypothetical protein
VAFISPLLRSQILEDPSNLFRKIVAEGYQESNSNFFRQSDRDFSLLVRSLHRDVNRCTHPLLIADLAVGKFPVDVDELSFAFA